MDKYAIYYAPKSTPGPVGYFIIKLYYEDDKKFEGFEYNKYKRGRYKFDKSMRTVVGKRHKHYIFEAADEKSALLIFEMMLEELPFKYE